MERFYSKESFIQHAEQQIRCNEDIVLALHFVKAVLADQDGKVFNKRILRLIDEVVQVKLPKTSTYSTDRGWCKELTILCRDHDSYRLPGVSGWAYVEYTEYLPVALKDGRIDGEGNAKQINEKIARLEKENERLSFEMEHVDEIEAEYNMIMSAASAFRGKYTYMIQKLYNVRG